jgi:hypothetical protein
MKKFNKIKYYKHKKIERWFVIGKENFQIHNKRRHAYNNRIMKPGNVLINYGLGWVVFSCAHLETP